MSANPEVNVGVQQPVMPGDLPGTQPDPAQPKPTKEVAEYLVVSDKTSEVRVLHSEGVYRHIRFQKPGTGCYHFDLVTLPGCLLYTGDMGTYVFKRTRDMFEFFRTKRGADGEFSIDHRYWAEKCEGQDKDYGLREFDPSAFKREITNQRRHIFVEHAKELSPDQRALLWGSLENVKNAASEGEHSAITAVQDWSFKTNEPSRWGGMAHVQLDTSDFPSCKTYTPRFMWCCQAIAWGIEQYDLQQLAAQEAEVAS